MKRKIILSIILIEVVLIIYIILNNPFLSLKINGEKELKLEINSEYLELGATSSFLGKDLTDKIKITGNVDSSKMGEYYIEYLVNYGIFSKKVVRKVIIADINPPVITLTEKDGFICDNYEEEGFKAIDDLDGDITDKVIVTNEKTRIVYKVKDSYGNETVTYRERKKDEISPVIKLNNSEILTFELNSKYVEFGVTAYDNCDGDITSKVEIETNVDTHKHENFIVTYKVKDSSLNESKIERKIMVYTYDDLNKGYNEIVAGPKYFDGILVVNKKYSIPSTFKAYNKEATSMINKLLTDAKKVGISLPMKSGNRTYNEQKRLYDYYKNKYGKEYADKRAARAGHSEHETGLAFDIGHANEEFGSTKEGIWLKENCSKYGFIIRYPKYKEGITGYGYEPWHVRYVGVEIATEIMNREITLEEYLNLYKFGL